MSVDNSKQPRQGPAEPTDLFESLAQALFRPMGVDGVYGRTSLYEDVIDRLSVFISRHREPAAEVLSFPPVMSRQQLEKSGYLSSFPNLLGCVCALHGTEAEIRQAADRHAAGGDWTASLAAVDLVLSPAACYPVYPMAASRGRIPPGGLRFDVACDCFRREPSKHLDRLQSFRMREFVCIGSAQEVVRFRARWQDHAQRLVDELSLPYRIAAASDPFFGRVGQVMAVAQIQQSLKFELLIPVYSAEQPTACMSFNYHQDHFGTTWGLRDEGGAVAHTGCVAFGMDRLAVALFRNHGLDPGSWPVAARKALAIG